MWSIERRKKKKEKITTVRWWGGYFRSSYSFAMKIRGWLNSFGPLYLSYPIPDFGLSSQTSPTRPFFHVAANRSLRDGKRDCPPLSIHFVRLCRPFYLSLSFFVPSFFLFLLCYFRCLFSDSAIRRRRPIERAENSLYKPRTQADSFLSTKSTEGGISLSPSGAQLWNNPRINSSKVFRSQIERRESFSTPAFPSLDSLNEYVPLTNEQFDRICNCQFIAFSISD